MVGHPMSFNLKIQVITAGSMNSPNTHFYIHSFTPFMIGQPIKGYRLVEIQPLNSEVKFEGRKDWK